MFECGHQEPVMMQKRGSSGLSAALAAAGLADPDILALAQVGIALAIDVGSVQLSWKRGWIDLYQQQD
jgi:hypothetical protein